MPLTDDLISYWTLDETSGTRVDSVIATGNDLTDNNTVTGADGIINGAGRFVRANGESLSRASNSGLQTGDIDFTVSGWVRLDVDNVTQMIVSKFESTGNLREYHLYYSTLGTFRFEVSSNGSATTELTASTFGAPAVDTFYFAVAWHDSVGNTLNIQINDGTVDSSAYSSGVASRTGAFNIGADETGSSSRMDGRIDEVGFWKRVLTASERTELYNSSAGLAYPFATLSSQGNLITVAHQIGIL